MYYGLEIDLQGLAKILFPMVDFVGARDWNVLMYRTLNWENVLNFTKSLKRDSNDISCFIGLLEVLLNILAEFYLPTRFQTLVKYLRVCNVVGLNGKKSKSTSDLGRGPIVPSVNSCCVPIS